MLENQILNHKSASKQPIDPISPPTVHSSKSATTLAYHLSAGEWNDFSNSLMNNIKRIIEDDLVHPIHAKHPFLGLLVSGLSAAASFAMLMPGLIPALTKPYALLSNTVGGVAQKITSMPIFSKIQLFDNAQNVVMAMDLLQPKHEQYQLDNTSLLAVLAAALGGLPQVAREPIERILPTLLQANAAQNSSDPDVLLKRDQLLFSLLILNQEKMLPNLDNTLKRELLMTARHLFKNTEGSQAQLRALHALFYPPSRTTLATHTITLITDYIPLIARCILSPITASAQPWRDLMDKSGKDITRLFHGVSKLINLVVKTVVRVAIRGIADVLTNEIAARFEGLIQKDSHRVSAMTYSIARQYEKGAEMSRQAAGTLVDAMRASVTAPAGQVVLTRALQRAATPSALGFFNQSGQHNAPIKVVQETKDTIEPTAEITTSSTV